MFDRRKAAFLQAIVRARIRKNTLNTGYRADAETPTNTASDHVVTSIR